MSVADYAAVVENSVQSYTGCMSRVEEIKAAIEQLSPEERCELAALLNPIEDDDWDRQMKKDGEPGGKLGRLMETATKEYKEGKSLPFPNPPREFEGWARILEAVPRSSARDSAIGVQELLALAK
jgi:hypothetical protein